MTELKPCPFCGETAVEVGRSAYDEDETWGIPAVYWVACKTCFAFGGDGETKEAAIAAWNKRIGAKQ